MGTAAICLCAVIVFIYYLWLNEVFSPFCSMMLVSFFRLFKKSCRRYYWLLEKVRLIRQTSRFGSEI